MHSEPTAVRRPRIVALFQSIFPNLPVALVATGGLAPLVSELSDEIDEHDRMLTLDGLRLVHALNNGQEGEG